jgi:hypothetical protein
MKPQKADAPRNGVYLKSKERCLLTPLGCRWNKTRAITSRPFSDS